MVLSVNESISALRNQSKSSPIAFNHIYRTWVVLLSEMERKPSNTGSLHGDSVVLILLEVCFLIYSKTTSNLLVVDLFGSNIPKHEVWQLKISIIS